MVNICRLVLHSGWGGNRVLHGAAGCRQMTNRVCDAPATVAVLPTSLAATVAGELQCAIYLRRLPWSGDNLVAAAVAPQPAV